MAENETMLIVERQGRVCTISLNRPHARNSLHPDLLTQLAEIMKGLNEDPETRAVVIRGIGEEAFSSGYDISSIPERVRAIGEYKPEILLGEAMGSIASYRFPVIAMIYGICMGAGCELALTCDLRIAADTLRMGMPPAKLGILYRPSGIQKFLDILGPAYTKELFYIGRPVDGQRALAMGLVNWIVPVSELSQFTYRIANEIAENAPLSVSGAKTIINKLLSYPRMTPEDAWEMEELLFSVRSSEDYREGQAAFREKRKPKFVGR